MKKKDIKATGLPFWSWNGDLTKEKLIEQIHWMKEKGYGGFFMHARAGLKVKYLSDEWFDCIRACCEEAKKLGMQAWAYDENGWPSGFVGGKLCDIKEYRNHFLERTIGEFDEKATFHYQIVGDKLFRNENKCDGEFVNVFDTESISYVDICNDEVVDAFIKETHDRYVKEVPEASQNLLGFFTDEPTYKNRPLPKKMRAYYMEKYGDDIFDYLGLLFVKKQGYEKFRYRYYRACQELMLKNYAKKLYDWHEQNGMQFTGHYVEERTMFTQMLSCGGIMSYYEYEHIPGIDWLCRRYMSVSVLKQVTSVAEQLGKPKVLSEMFAMTGWDATAKELKSMAEYQYNYGVNLACHHLLPYTEKGLRKDDHPSHFSSINPWVNKGMYEFNQYFDALGEWIRNSTQNIDVAVFFTNRSSYLDYDYYDWSSCAELDESYVDACENLANHNVPFHIVDETLLAKYGSVKGDKLCLAKGSYSVLIIPKIYVMDATTDKLLREFVANGGKVILLDQKPYLLEGEPYDFDYLNTNYTLDQVYTGTEYKVEYDGIELHTSLREVNGKKYVFLVNIDDKKEIIAKVSIGDKVLNAKYDVTTDEVAYIGEQITIRPEEAVIVCEYEGEPIIKAKPQVVKVGSGEYEIVDYENNYFALDFAEVSYNGKDYEPRQALVKVFERLLKERYDGDVYLKYTFDTKILPKEIKLMIEDAENISATVNGKPVEFTEKSAFDEIYTNADISSAIKLGKNEVIVKYHFFQNEDVYYALYGENVGPGVRNCMCYDTEIQNVYLCGKFGVYSNDMTDGDIPIALHANTFYIDEAPTKTTKITENGFAFFTGAMTLKTTFNCDGGQTELNLQGRYHYAEIKVNGKDAGALMFSNFIDVSDFVVKGENTLEVTLYSGNRNFFGTHHQKNNEIDNYVDPSCFEFRDDDETFTESYTLSKFGLFDNE